jgi:uncharacterized protein
MRTLEPVGVYLDLPDTTPVLVLREVDGERRQLVIPIGFPEANWIAYALKGVTLARPVTQQLLADVLVEYGLSVHQAVISGFRNGNFHAHLDLVGIGETRVVSCRPSDAVGLLLRLPGAGPLLAVDDVMDRYGQASAGLVGDPGDQADEDVVGDQGRPAVGDEGQGDPGDRKEAEDPGHDEEGLKPDDGGQAGGKELGEVGAGPEGGA